MFFKKIRHGLDLRKNKIINTYIDNPVEPKEISNKEYVDLGDKYDTVKATTKPISTKFNWVTNVGNTTIKEVLDKLLFTVVYPIYINPKLKMHTIVNLGESNNVFGNYINGELYYEMNESDRTPTSVYRLVVKFNDDTEVTFNDTLSVGKITFNFIWNNIQSIKLKQVFTPVVVKNDSDGVPFIDSNFSTTYDFEYDFQISKFINIFNISKGIYHKLNITNSNLDTYLTDTETNLKDSFIFGNLITLQTQLTNNIQSNPNNTLLLIHESLINKFCNITFKKDNISLSSLEIHIGQKLLLNVTNEYYKVSFSDGYYYFALIDFGKYNVNTKALISF